jgi:hypothetical protein
MELYKKSSSSDEASEDKNRDKSLDPVFLHKEYFMSRYTHKSSQGCVYFVRGPDKVEYILKVF